MATKTTKAPEYPTITIDGTTYPDVHAMKRELKMKWDDIMVAIHGDYPQFVGHKLVRLGYEIELAKNPDLQIDPDDGDAIAEARDKSKLRWDRIAVYCGKTEGHVRKVYEQATKIDTRTHFVGRGRRFELMNDGPKKVGEVPRGKAAKVAKSEAEDTPAKPVAAKRPARKARTRKTVTKTAE